MEGEREAARWEPVLAQPRGQGERHGAGGGASALGSLGLAGSWPRARRARGAWHKSGSWVLPGLPTPPWWPLSLHTPARPQRPAAGRRDAGLAGVLEWSGPAAVTPWGRLQASEARWSQGTRSRTPMPRCTEVPRRGSEQATLLCVTERMAACAPGPDWGAPPGRSLRGTDQRLSLTSRRGGRRHEGR